MPIHDWTRVDHGTFHDFHQGWAPQIRSALDDGLLPPDYEAKVEQHTDDASEFASDPYTRLRKTITVRRDDRIVALIELVPPGNKSSRHGIQAFVRKVAAAIDHGIHVLVVDLFPHLAGEFGEITPPRHGIHVLVVDLFPPGPRDPSGVHPVIWSEFRDEPHAPPANQPLTLVSYEAGAVSRAYIQPTAVGAVLPDMPLFLEPGAHVNVPLETTYTAAFEGISRRTRDALNAPG
jgi:hypothetical protein